MLCIVSIFSQFSLFICVTLFFYKGDIFQIFGIPGLFIQTKVWVTLINWQKKNWHQGAWEIFSTWIFTWRIFACQNLWVFSLEFFIFSRIVIYISCGWLCGVYGYKIDCRHGALKGSARQLGCLSHYHMNPSPPPHYFCLPIAFCLQTAWCPKSVIFLVPSVLPPNLVFERKSVGRSSLEVCNRCSLVLFTLKQAHFPYALAWH